MRPLVQHRVGSAPLLSFLRAQWTAAPPPSFRGPARAGSIGGAGGARTACPAHALPPPPAPAPPPPPVPTLRPRRRGAAGREPPGPVHPPPPCTPPRMSRSPSATTKSAPPAALYSSPPRLDSAAAAALWHGLRGGMPRPRPPPGGALPRPCPPDRAARYTIIRRVGRPGHHG